MYIKIDYFLGIKKIIMKWIEVWLKDFMLNIIKIGRLLKGNIIFFCLNIEV